MLLYICNKKKERIETMKELICPFCGNTIYDDGDIDIDCLDIEFFYTKVILHMIGICPNCEKEYQWEKIYKFDRYDNLREG
jgi:predicted RNA-binding Zn-ribbon protein involved in translation (DUF1610 family)